MSLSTRGATHRVMTPLELVARVIALIPPPYHHLVRFHGVFAPHHTWRAEVVALCPSCPTRTPACGVHRAATPLPPVLAAADSTAEAPAGKTEEAPQAPPRRWRGWVDWATLLSKTFGLDVLACPRCGQRMRLLEVVLHPDLIRWWLLRVGLAPDEPP